MRWRIGGDEAGAGLFRAPRPCAGQQDTGYDTPAPLASLASSHTLRVLARRTRASYYFLISPIDGAALLAPSRRHGHRLLLSACCISRADLIISRAATFTAMTHLPPRQITSCVDDDPPALQHAPKELCAARSPICFRKTAMRYFCAIRPSHAYLFPNALRFNTHGPAPPYQYAKRACMIMTTYSVRDNFQTCRIMMAAFVAHRQLIYTP